MLDFEKPCFSVPKMTSVCVWQHRPKLCQVSASEIFIDRIKIIHLATVHAGAFSKNKNFSPVKLLHFGVICCFASVAVHFEYVK